PDRSTDPEITPRKRVAATPAAALFLPPSDPARPDNTGTQTAASTESPAANGAPAGPKRAAPAAAFLAAAAAETANGSGRHEPGRNEPERNGHSAVPTRPAAAHAAATDNGATPAPATPTKAESPEGPLPKKAATAKKTAPAKKTAAAKTVAPSKSTAAKKAAPTKSTPAKKAAPSKQAKPTANATPAKKATQAKKTVPAKKAAPAPPAPSVAVATEVRERPGVWLTVRQQPQHIPSALALAAVGRYADEARTKAEWLRTTYPDVGADRLARVATRTARRRTGLAALATALPFGGVATASGHLWAYARLVLDVAAVYGFDPADPARAADVLALLGIYPDARAARAAVRAASGEAADDGRRAPALPRLGSVTRALGWRTASRVVPASGLILASLAGATDVADLGERAIRFYRDAAA
ncbi:MAG TPA: hypothetical protein VKB59_17285, partial [Micromonosporaceae bacterium]|nr:hypothetical protein [Micromonosporaceae bacterium]